MANPNRIIPKSKIKKQRRLQICNSPRFSDHRSVNCRCNRALCHRVRWTRTRQATRDSGTNYRRRCETMGIEKNRGGGVVLESTSYGEDRETTPSIEIQSTRSSLPNRGGGGGGKEPRKRKPLLFARRGEGTSAAIRNDER